MWLYPLHGSPISESASTRRPRQSRFLSVPTSRFRERGLRTSAMTCTEGISTIRHGCAATPLSFSHPLPSCGLVASRPRPLSITSPLTPHIVHPEPVVSSVHGTGVAYPQYPLSGLTPREGYSALDGVGAIAGILYGNLLIFLVGLGLALFVWLTTPRRYDLFRDRLVVSYGKPRRSVVSLSEIENTDVVSLPVGGTRLIVRRKRGRPLVLSPEDPHGFQEELEKALAPLG